MCPYRVFFFSPRAVGVHLVCIWVTFGLVALADGERREYFKVASGVIHEGGAQTPSTPVVSVE